VAGVARSGEGALNPMSTPLESPIKYSLIIATLDDDGDLTPCLESLARLNPGPVFEVIVVDQNGDDRLVQSIASFESRLPIRHERVAFRGACRARNHGARLARGEWLGFPDDDCELLPDLLQKVERLASDPRVRVITGRIIDTKGAPNVLRWGGEQRVFNRWTMFGCLTEATLFVQRTLFWTVGGFDERFGPGERFPAAEGIDLMNRMFGHIGQGVAIYSPQVQMRHPSKIPPWNRWAVSRFHAYARGDGALIAKSFEPHMLYWGLRTMVAATLQLFTLQGWKSLAFAARLTGLFRGLYDYCRRPPARD
jgi:glycosyltransferase involved in cell wall biosynthesis